MTTLKLILILLFYIAFSQYITSCSGYKYENDLKQYQKEIDFCKLLFTISNDNSKYEENKILIDSTVRKLSRKELLDNISHLKNSTYKLIDVTQIESNLGHSFHYFQKIEEVKEFYVIEVCFIFQICNEKGECYVNGFVFQKTFYGNKFKLVQLFRDPKYKNYFKPESLFDELYR